MRPLFLFPRPYRIPRRYGPRARMYPHSRRYPARLVITVGRTERTYMDTGKGQRLVSERPAR